MLEFNEILIMVFLGIVVLDVVALRNAFRSQFVNGAIKLYYLFIILCLPIFGALIYYLWADKYKVQ